MIEVDYELSTEITNFLRRARRRKGSGKGDLSGAVIAALSGTPGFALDFADSTTMWTDSGKTTQVVANAAIRVITSKWGATPYDVDQVSSGPRPLWNGVNAADYDGTDDHLVVGAASWLNNKPAAFFCGRILSDTLVAQQPVFGISSALGTTSRFRLLITPAGELSLNCRNVDTGSSTTVTTAAGTIVEGQACVITADCDFAGTGAIRVFKNGVSVGTATLIQAVSNTQATDSARFWIGRNISALEYINGRMGRMVFADKLMTTDERTAIEAWVGQGTMT